MLFSLEWLLQLCPTGSDAARIAAALTDRGLTVDSIEPAGEDHVLAATSLEARRSSGP